MMKEHLPRCLSLFLCLLLLLCGAACSEDACSRYGGEAVPPSRSESEVHIVALDPGHGGTDSGAQGIVPEVSVCEATCDLLFTMLDQDALYLPFRTRLNGTDLSIKKRAQAVTEAHADILLSIHANSDHSTRQSHGFECFPSPPGRVHHDAAMKLAQCIAQRMGNAGHRLRGENGIRFAYYSGKSKHIVDSTDTRVRQMKSFGILEKSDCPAVLIEQCFLTNDSDVENWTGAAGCRRAAYLYYSAICDYFGTVPLDLQSFDLPDTEKTDLPE